MSAMARLPLLLPVALLALGAFAAPAAHAQRATPPGTLPPGTTFFEDFESTPVGELPEGWTYYEEGGTLPDAHWFVFNDFGRKIAYSGAEPGNGEPDEDWLITPQITPAPGDILFFDATQGLFED